MELRLRTIHTIRKNPHMPKGTIYYSIRYVYAHTQTIQTRNAHILLFRLDIRHCAKFKGTQKRNDHNRLKDGSICTAAEEFHKAKKKIENKTKLHTHNKNKWNKIYV